MSIAVACEQCGWKAAVKDEMAGKKGKCPTCGEPIAVPKQVAPTDDVEAAAAAALSEGDEGPAPPTPSSYVPAAPYSAAASSTPSPGKTSHERANPARGIKFEYRTKEQVSERRGIAISGGVMVGLLMMGGAVLWFVLGWAAGRIFFYPPILFILGLVNFIRSLTGRED